MPSTHVHVCTMYMYAPQREMLHSDPALLCPAPPHASGCRLGRRCVLLLPYSCCVLLLAAYSSRGSTGVVMGSKWASPSGVSPPMYTYVYACICMYMHVFACICMYMHACMYACMRGHRRVGVSPPVCICTYVYVHMYMHTCMRGHRRVGVSPPVYTHVYACICMNVCMYTCMRGHRQVGVS